MKYAQEHGEYEVSTSQQTVLFAGRGPWNDETLRRGTEEMGNKIKQMELTKPWGGLSCLYGESLMPPTAYKSFEKQTIYRKKLGMTALAVVIQNSQITNTIKSQLTKAYQAAGLDFVFMSNIEQAMTWLQEKGIKFDNQQALQFFQQHSFIEPEEY